MGHPFLTPGPEWAATHEGTESLAINNTFSRRLLTRLALKTLGRFYKSDGLCTPISKHAIVKTGFRVHLTEAATMKFVAENTTIPVPKVYCSFVHRGRAFILMERIQGDDIPSAWKRLAEPGRQKVYTQLRGMLQQLRALKPPSGTGVESCIGGSLHDSRIKQCHPRYGPFKTIQEFHFWLREGFQPSDVKTRQLSESEYADIEKMVEMQDGPWPVLVFTHADLNPLNILMRDGEVVGIIDWEFAGWLPHYWEFTSAWHGNATRLNWRDSLYRFLDPPPSRELKMENTRNLWWGEI
ncbi:hypothetical protein Q7P37_005463 [Cladosporium fusiforme]